MPQPVVEALGDARRFGEDALELARKHCELLHGGQMHRMRAGHLRDLRARIHFEAHWLMPHFVGGGCRASRSRS